MLDNLSFLERPRLHSRVSVLGVPLDLGKDNIGTEAGPAVLRQTGMVRALESLGLVVTDLGDISCQTRSQAEIGDIRMKYADAIVAAGEQVAHKVCSEIKLGNSVVVLGGDHSLSLGSISGAADACDREMGVIWIDAHGDINTHETTLSGNVHGMPLAGVLGMGHETLVNMHSPGQKVKPENVLYIGLKDLDKAEIDIIRKHSIAAVTAMDVATHGLRPVFEEIVKLCKRVKKVWVSFDLDSVDEAFAPGTPMASKGGLTYREIFSITKYIGKLCTVVGMDVVEFAPHLDVEGKTARLSIELVANVLGSEYNWYTDYMHKEAEKQVDRAVMETVDSTI